MSPRGAAVVNAAWWLSLQGEARAFARALRDPRAAQEAVARGILARARGSVVGREHHLERARTLRDLREALPLRDHADHAPWIERVAAGERAVLSRERVLALEPTSGTGGGAKLIPTTASVRAAFTRALAPWLDDLFRADPDLTRGPAYWSISPALQRARRSAGGVPIGFDDDGAYLGPLAAALARLVQAVPADVRHLGDVDAFRYATLLHLLARPDLRLASVWNPSFFLLLLDALPRFAEPLLRDLREGRSRPPGGDERPSLAPRANRRRARQVERALRGASDAHVAALWPRLGLVSCWADGAAAGPAAALARRVAPARLQAKGLLATEAFVTLPRRGAVAAVPALRSHVLEFLAPDGSARFVDELDAGASYEVIVTTGVLYRYRLGDLVRVEGHLGRTPLLRFLGRAQGVVDQVGEKLHEGHVADVVAAALRALGAEAVFTLLAPDGEAARPGYALFVEGVPASHHAALARSVDDGLRSNPHYAYARDLGQLGAVRVVSVEHGAERFEAAAAERGQRRGDVKPAALSARTDWRRSFRDPPSSSGDHRVR